MRYLGIDYGQKRIGLALSDPEGRLAFPHATVSGLGEVLEVIRQAGVAAVVVGLPVPLGGGESAQSRAVRAFADRLGAAVQLPIALSSEALTTNIAEQHTARNKADAAAAALILQSYLDQKNP